jgi:hypothetical protein
MMEISQVLMWTSIKVTKVKACQRVKMTEIDSK